MTRVAGTPSRALTWSVWAVATVGIVAIGLLAWSYAQETSGATPADVVAGVSLVAALAAFVLCGALIASRQPRNIIGWLLLIPGLALPLSSLASNWLAGIDPPPEQVTPGLWLLLWALSWSWIALIFPIFHLLLTFPEGRLLSPRWRWAVALEVLMVTTMLVFAGLKSDLLLIIEDQLLWSVPNPVGVVANDLFDSIGTPWDIALLTLTAAGAVAIALRFRRGTLEERQQLKWTLLAVVLFVAVFLISAIDADANGNGLIPIGVGLAGIPISVAIAVLRYRLYAIDRIISRTVSWAVITTLLLTVFIAIVFALQAVLVGVTQAQTVAVAASTLVAAALFQPLRGRVQNVVDRRFDRASVDAEPGDRGLRRPAARRGRPRLAHPRSRGHGGRRRPAESIARVAAAGRRMMARAIGVAAAVALLIAVVVDLRAGTFSVQLVAIAVAVASYLLSGILIIERRPGNVVGPLVLVLGLALVGYVVLDSIVHTASPTPVIVAALLVNELDGPMFLIVAMLLLFFPDGALPSAAWRWLVLAGVALATVVTLGALFRPGPYAYYPWLENPLGEAANPLLAAWDAAYVLEILVVALAALSLVGRWRRGGAVERAQIKWVAVAGAILAGAMLTYGAIAGPGRYSDVGDLLVTIGLSAIPIAIGIAILRYRLYEIDRLISRTIGYAIVTGILGATFVVTVIGVQALLSSFTQSQTIAVAASTLVAFALFQPVRRRVQGVVDHRFDRSRFDGERTAAAFADRLRSEVAIESVVTDLEATVAGAMRSDRAGALAAAGRRGDPRPAMHGWRAGAVWGVCNASATAGS